MINRLIIFFISMFPFIELRGSIPYSQVLKINLIEAYIISIIGNILIIPVIYYLVKNILLWGKNIKYIDVLSNFAIKKGYDFGKKLENKGGFSLYFTIFLFVAIPIPGTGVWTATVSSSLLNLEFKKVLLANVIGVITAGIIMSFASYGIISIIN